MAMKILGTAQHGAAVAIALILGGCTAMGGNGGFPDPDDAFARGGMLESSRAIRTIQTGMTKDQVRGLLGNPHFSEGLFNVRTWNYLFDLDAEDGHTRQMCQFQLVFDAEMRVEDTRWRTAKCAVRFSAIEASPIESTTVLQRFSLPIADMFTVDDGALTDEAQRVLGEFAALLQRDFSSSSLAIASYPVAGQHRRQRLAVQQFLKAHTDIDDEGVRLTDGTSSPCEGGNVETSCRGTEKVVIQILGSSSNGGDA
ncbi:outer membrane protein assembly factor BamE [Halomonas organivorans]|uniref:Outer membrane protein assembly factor BamE (Lipoprotein component of BamABCDE complex) n=1 Tax=Halomonas organivorans TaxID=257772 RepID=A0A7W5G7Z2_9GAMM|nr:outer membrane protein assembly factor BamE [Halomonas organivorans]MBB3143061.1 outer membrane protein assembly factor BamE (lipoprotein component of BamABCDE complex) [Halomonas organivorans]